jgi:hypothetical protein
MLAPVAARVQPRSRVARPTLASTPAHAACVTRATVRDIVRAMLARCLVLVVLSTIVPGQALGQPPAPRATAGEVAMLRRLAKAAGVPAKQLSRPDAKVVELAFTEKRTIGLPSGTCFLAAAVTRRGAEGARITISEPGTDNAGAKLVDIVPAPTPGATQRFCTALFDNRRDLRRHHDLAAAGTGVAVLMVFELGPSRAEEPVGDDDGSLGVEAGDESDPPPRLPTPPMVDSSVLEALRIAGEPVVAPDPATAAAIARSGKTRVSGVFVYCVLPTGAVRAAIAAETTGSATTTQRSGARSRRGDSDRTRWMASPCWFARG